MVQNDQVVHYVITASSGCSAGKWDIAFYELNVFLSAQDDTGFHRLGPLLKREEAGKGFSVKTQETNP